jgi:peptidoglycan/LPS O-acetylase OafA/YrhL
MHESPIRGVLATPLLQDNHVLSSGKRLLQRMAAGLIPSFVQRPISNKPQRLHPTSYLDGLRGVASFIVFMGHYTEENLGWWTEPYGMYEDGARSTPLQLPIIRVIYSARPMVHIFFIISGFVLSYKPLKQIHMGSYSALAATLSSSVFRRGLRLFLPSLITLFIMALAVHFGISDDRYAMPTQTLSEQLAHWYSVCWSLFQSAWSLNLTPQPQYNPALWTIPIEFSQSLLLFIIIIGLSRCLTNVRLLLLGAIIAFSFYSGEIFAMEFLGGMFIAEVTLLQNSSLITPTSSPTISPLPKYREKEDFVTVSPQESKTTKHSAMQIFWMLNVVSGLFIASWTNFHPDEVWGIRTLNAHTPWPYEGQAIWFCFGAFQIVIACTQVPFLQNIFNTPLAQYLGNISYALYLVHNLCLTILEPRVTPLIDMYFSKATMWGRQFSWVMGLVIYLPIILTVADFFWRAVDMPTVKFARWLEEKCVVQAKKI